MKQVERCAEHGLYLYVKKKDLGLLMLSIISTIFTWTITIGLYRIDQKIIEQMSKFSEFCFILLIMLVSMGCLATIVTTIVYLNKTLEEK